MLHGEHLTFKIISGDDIIYTPEEYKINKQVSSLVLKISNVDMTTLSVREAYQFIEELKEIADTIKL